MFIELGLPNIIFTFIFILAIVSQIDVQASSKLISSITKFIIFWCLFTGIVTFNTVIWNSISGLWRLL